MNKKTKVLYVKNDQDNEMHPCAGRELESIDFEEGEEVAIYELKEVKTYKIKVELV